ncbi:unnamed protein product, partial [Mesorhabditis spiculigera]
MPTIYASGTLAKKLYINLQEPTGRFPAAGHFQADNLVVRCGKTHIMSKASMVEWVKECVADPNNPEIDVFLLDHWTGFLDHELFNSALPDGVEIEIINIPAGTTGIVQPLDLYFFCPVKAMIKRIHAYVITQSIDFTIFKRDHILMVISQVYWTICSPVFTEFLKYCWFRGGYLDTHPLPFETPNQFSLNPANCSIGCKTCGEDGLIKCAYCYEVICFDCFFVKLHRCA